MEKWYRLTYICTPNSKQQTNMKITKLQWTDGSVIGTETEGGIYALKNLNSKLTGDSDESYTLTVGIDNLNPIRNYRSNPGWDAEYIFTLENGTTSRTIRAPFYFTGNLNLNWNKIGKILNDNLK